MPLGLAALTIALSTDPTPADTIRGRVTWLGDIPQPTPVMAYRPGPNGVVTASLRPAPNVPHIDSDSRSVAGVLISLRGDGLSSSKPWPYPPVTVEIHDERPMIVQGGERRNLGIVRRGDSVTLVSRQAVFHSLRARGTAFWSLAFPDPEKPLPRSCDRLGLVDLTSGAGYYWMQGYLWVTDHPFVALTDATGRFELTGVPAGEYEVTAWLPNWRVARQERDPESTAVVRLAFDKPHEAVKRAKPGSNIDFTLPK